MSSEEVDGRHGVVDRQSRLDVDPRVVHELVDFVLRAEGREGCVTVAFVDDDEQSELHERFLGVSGPTDVITFPLADDIENSVLGEVVVSTDTAVRQAADHGEPPIEADPDRECLLYVVHGVLHLLGYDDHDPAEAEVMSRRQDALFSSWWNQREH